LERKDGLIASLRRQADKFDAMAGDIQDQLLEKASALETLRTELGTRAGIIAGLQSAYNTSRREIKALAGELSQAAKQRLGLGVALGLLLIVAAWGWLRRPRVAAG
jgi:chromosome segregation ATPase